MNLIAKRCRNDETAVYLGWVKGYEGMRQQMRRRRRQNLTRRAESARAESARAKSKTLITEEGVK